MTDFKRHPHPNPLPSRERERKWGGLPLRERERRDNSRASLFVMPERFYQAATEEGAFFSVIFYFFRFLLSGVIGGLPPSFSVLSSRNP